MVMGPFGFDSNSISEVSMTRDTPKMAPIPLKSESAPFEFLEQRLLQIKYLNPTSFSGSYGPAHVDNKYFDKKKPNEKYQFFTTLPDPVAIGANIETIHHLEQFVQFYVLPKTYFSGVTKAVMKE
jgi:hypothetical protein